jgi:hypothetical protein
LRSSAESSGSQFFSFLATKAHFSSNWTSRVLGGKSHQFVVKVAGVVAGPSAQTADRAAIDLAESTGLADTTPLGDVFQDRFELLSSQSRVEEGRPLALGEANLADAATEHASFFVRAVATGHSQISDPSLAKLGAVGIEATEAREVIHVAAPPVRS